MTRRTLASITIENRTYDIVASIHAQERMVERNVDPYVVTGNVLALGPERIKEYQRSGAQTMIIDEDNDVSVLVGFRYGKITIITAIDRANIFVKENTQVVNI